MAAAPRLMTHVRSNDRLGQRNERTPHGRVEEGGFQLRGAASILV